LTLVVGVKLLGNCVLLRVLGGIWLSFVPIFGRRYCLGAGVLVLWVRSLCLPLTDRLTRCGQLGRQVVVVGGGVSV